MNKEDTEKAMDLIMLRKKLSKDISEVAIKIVAYFNRDEMSGQIWDTKMYEQKRVVIELLNQLNQNKEDE